MQLDDTLPSKALDHLLKGLGHVKGNVGHGLVSVTLDDPLVLQHALDVISHLPGVKHVEADYVLQPFDDSVTPLDVSNDPLISGGQAWGMYGDLTARVNAFGSQAGEAWVGGYTGSTKVAVAVVDTGVDYTHPDLYLNIWLNQAEIPLAFKSKLTDTDGDGRITFRDLNNAANAAYVTDVNANGRIDAGDLLHDVRWSDGVDQDGNGYTDDLIGWDFKNNDNDPMDDAGHGTHVAGIVAAQGGNSVGVAGVTWNTQIVVAKFLDASGGYTSDAVRALDYVTQASQASGAIHIVATNDSWGGGGPSQALTDAVVRGANANILFVAAAGNGGADQIGDNNDTTPNYPSNISTTAGAGYDAVLAVASLTSTGTLSSFSNYGVNTVDLAAPGSGIYSTLMGGSYGLMSGTSMAAPFVAGAIAAYAAANPGATADQIRTALLTSTLATASLVGKTVTGGRLDVSDFIYSASPGGMSLTGGAANDTVSITSAFPGQQAASVFNDTLSGGGGDDKLDGGPGADRLLGGPGNDTFTVDNAGDTVVENSGEGSDLVNSSISYILPANVEKLTLTGAAAINGTGNGLDNTITGNGANNLLDGGVGNDALSGGVGDDTLIGGDGNDRLTGGTGADSMAGGAGDDSYDVDSAGDTVLENAGEGNDLVNSSVTYVLADTVERLTLTGAAAIDGTGNALANTLNGNAANNYLSGLGGADALAGLGGDDTLIGGDGNDRLTGGAGADSMAGGAGDDTYDVDDPGDTVVENAGEGNDLVNSTVTFTLSDTVERLTLTGAASVNGTGNALANTITGNAGDNLLSGLDGADTITAGAGNDTLLGGDGADKLTGGTGADSMAGGNGDDTYDVDDPGDTVLENPGEGNDLVNSTATFTLSDNVERLTLTGAAAVNGTGNALANTITGNAANNVLSGLDGVDTLTGGAGNDTLLGGDGADKLTGGTGADSMAGGNGDDSYDVDDTGDVIVENAGEGDDLVTTSVTYTLSANVERLTQTGTAALNATGNDLANILTGNGGNNVLKGMAGGDALIGGAGADTLDGGADADRLSGGAGADRFVFQTGEAAGDTVTDFSVGDKLELHGYGAGSTIAAVGTTGNWIITDGVTHATETITLSNHYVLSGSDYIFT
ncbi:MAG: S8 family serine peptidase [Caulobacterales bacterium]|nr:S8 family serine peptidase [Caulobacterales bacterium]